MTNNDIVQKLWNLCDVLRDDGINYSDYVTELVLRCIAVLATILQRPVGHRFQYVFSIRNNPLSSFCFGM